MGRLLESLKETGKRIKELVNNFVKPGSEIGGLSLADGEVDLSKLDISPEMKKAFEESEKAMKNIEERLEYIPEEEHKKTFKAGKKVNDSQEVETTKTQIQQENENEIER